MFWEKADVNRSEKILKNRAYTSFRSGREVCVGGAVHLRKRVVCSQVTDGHVRDVV